MNKKFHIFILTDYKGYFGSNYGSLPYRSGFNLEIMSEVFKSKDIILTIIKISDVQHHKIQWKDKIVLYTSNEEIDFRYKSYIEDVILFLKIEGAVLLPNYEILRANNNKSFMEMYKKHMLHEKLDINSFSYGSLEDVIKDVNSLQFPLVFKTSEGAMSRGVRLVHNEKELIRSIKKYRYSSKTYIRIKDLLRSLIHRGYVLDSLYQKKFIVQSFIRDLKNDWKILVFGDIVFVLKRGIKENDFRASGSHVNYEAGSKSNFPLEQLDNIMDFKEKLNTPNVSLDFVYDGNNGFIIEFQGLYFGLSTIDYSNDYYQKQNGTWILMPNNFKSKEEIFVYSIYFHLKSIDKLK